MQRQESFATVSFRVSPLCDFGFWAAAVRKPKQPARNRTFEARPSVRPLPLHSNYSIGGGVSVKPRVKLGICRCSRSRLARNTVRTATHDLHVMRMALALRRSVFAVFSLAPPRYRRPTILAREHTAVAQQLAYIPKSLIFNVLS